MSPRPRVLYIAGLGRSGSTLLDRALGEVPGYQSLGEVVHLWQRGVIDNERCGAGEPFHSCPFWTKIGHVAFGGWGRFDAPTALALQQRVDRTRYVPRLATARMAPSFRTRLERYASLLGDVYTAAAEVSGAAVLVDSSKHASMAYVLRHVGAVDLSVLHLVRDPRAVAYAWTKVKARPSGGADAVMARYAPVKTATHYSVQNAMLDALSLSTVPYLRMRYEDFTAAPIVSIRRAMGLTGAQDDALGFIEGHDMVLGANHNVGGNPMKYLTGAITIARDDDWEAHMGRGSKYLVSAMTAPHLIRYRYGFGGRVR